LTTLNPGPHRRACCRYRSLKRAPIFRAFRNPKTAKTIDHLIFNQVVAFSSLCRRDQVPRHSANGVDSKSPTVANGAPRGDGSPGPDCRHVGAIVTSVPTWKWSEPLPTWLDDCIAL
jgi:hypothetical protein